MTDEQKEAFSFAKDLFSTINTLSTAALVFSVTMIDKVVAFADNDHVFLYAAWFFLTFTIVAGIAAIAALVANLQPVSGEPNLSIRSRNVVTCSALQILCFIASLVMLVIFAMS